ncbi:PTS sugar transporter subunit IIB [Enterococcus hulanensis]|uniref:PTS sugar transporter subunit IIB n=1 Tax=Enterococcus hulanensis TaxID=2559929 RepID=UPI001A90755F|nr:PTS sugar transporter subunit IIB [Enterococcus hulanensis]MBO0456164.1 PTS sugar transporter subunit IIB [Enterococcus hulanensis]
MILQNVIIRLDDRFIHGQIVLSWLKVLNGKRIIIIDEEMIKDPFMYTLFQMALPDDVSFEIFDCTAGILYLKENLGEVVLVLVRSLSTLEKMYSEGLRFKEVMIGRIPFKNGRRKRCEDVYLTSDEERIIENMLEKEVEVVVQMVPDSERHYLKKKE